MLAQLKSATLLGLSVSLVEIEVDAAAGLPAWDIVGLPDTAVKESKERVRPPVRRVRQVKAPAADGQPYPAKAAALLAAQADLEEAHAPVAAQHQINPDLADAVENSDDPDRQADIARGKLGLVEPGERVFYFTN